MNKNIWVLCEHTKAAAPHTLQLLHKANELAGQIGAKVSVVYVGPLSKKELEELVLYGAENVIYCQCKVQDEFVYTKALASMVKEKEPGLIMFPASSLGKTLAASLSSEFEAGLTADCIEIDCEEDGFVFLRAALNHTVIAKIKGIHSKLQMCTVRQNVFTAATVGTAGKLHMEEFIYESSENPLSLVGLINQKEKGKSTHHIGLSKVVFTVGRGIGNKENFDKLLKIAQRLNAEVLGTRAAVEEGYMEKYRQVGQSGINICPDLYIGFGISGASQHMVGIKNAKVIIAVNSDEFAPIFDYADYAIVDDVSSVLEELEMIC
ncbi:MAG: electron transfer flavoprotein subunit alpha/FixB family protein [Hungatella sp.]|jgi:electron transfer flavoprotein alpha subunit|nr:electron transfer flavoprotein subunit alpha/FixB family protein [Hungatella sp.]